MLARIPIYNYIGYLRLMALYTSITDNFADLVDFEVDLLLLISATIILDIYIWRSQYAGLAEFNIYLFWPTYFDSAPVMVK